jgi:hypothetical protein
MVSREERARRVDTADDSFSDRWRHAIDGKMIRLESFTGLQVGLIALVAGMALWVVREGLQNKRLAS